MLVDMCGHKAILPCLRSMLPSTENETPCGIDGPDDLHYIWIWIILSHQSHPTFMFILNSRILDKAKFVNPQKE